MNVFFYPIFMISPFKNGEEFEEFYGAIMGKQCGCESDMSLLWDLSKTSQQIWGFVGHT